MRCAFQIFVPITCNNLVGCKALDAQRSATSIQTFQKRLSDTASAPEFRTSNVQKVLNATIWSRQPCPFVHHTATHACIRTTQFAQNRRVLRKCGCARAVKQNAWDGWEICRSISGQMIDNIGLHMHSRPGSADCYTRESDAAIPPKHSAYGLQRPQRGSHRHASKAQSSLTAAWRRGCSRMRPWASFSLVRPWRPRRLWPRPSR